MMIAIKNKHEKLEVNVERAAKIARILADNFIARKGVFSDQKELVENQLPKNVETLSKEHALFIFYVVPQDYATRSARLYKKAKALFEEHREFFDPSHIANMGIDEVRQIISMRIGARFPGETAQRWLSNSISLINEYNGDPREIFNTSKDAREALKRIRKFRGFGPKTGALFLRSFVNLGFTKLSNISEILMPVDVHDTRIAFYTKCIYGSDELSKYLDNYAKYTRQVQRLWSQASQSAGVDWLILDRALWLLGSKRCIKDKHTGCPIRALCVKGEPISREEQLVSFLKF